jgi:hypothetical protein
MLTARMALSDVTCLSGWADEVTHVNRNSIFKVLNFDLELSLLHSRVVLLFCQGGVQYIRRIGHLYLYYSMRHIRHRPPPVRKNISMTGIEWHYHVQTSKTHPSYVFFSDHLRSNEWTKPRHVSQRMCKRHTCSGVEIERRQGEGLAGFWLSG